MDSASGTSLVLAEPVADARYCARLQQLRAAVHRLRKRGRWADADALTSATDLFVDMHLAMEAHMGSQPYKELAMAEELAHSRAQTLVWVTEMHNFVFAAVAPAMAAVEELPEALIDLFPSLQLEVYTGEDNHETQA